MLTCILLTTLLSTNKFDNFYYGVNISIKTKVLTLDQIPERQEFRLTLILNLHEQGLSNKQIAEHLNTNKILSPRGHEYSQKLIWGTLKKIKKREERKVDTVVSIDNPKIYRREVIHL